MPNDIYITYCLFKLEAPQKKGQVSLYQANQTNKQQNYVVDFTIFD